MGGLTPRENALIAYRHQQPAWIPCFYTDIALIQACPAMERYTGHTIGKDYFGVEWTYEPNIHAPMPTPGKIHFEDIKDWREHVKLPDLDAIDWENQADIDVHTDFQAFVMGAGLVPFKDGSSIYDTDKLRVCMILNGPFERLHSYMGFENALMALVSDPEECSAYFETLFNWKIEYLKKIKQYYDIDIINFHDDYGAADRMSMNPDLWRQIIKPHADPFPDLRLVKVRARHFLKSHGIGDEGLLELREHSLRRGLEGGRVLIPPIYPNSFDNPVFVYYGFRALDIGDPVVYGPDPELVHALAIAQGIEAGHDVLGVFPPLVARHIVAAADVHLRPPGRVEAL